MYEICQKLVESIKDGEKCLVYMEQVDAPTFQVLFNGPVAPIGVSLLTEQDSWHGKSIMTDHDGIFIRVIAPSEFSAADFDRYFIPLAGGAMKFCLKLVQEMGVSPYKIHVREGAFSANWNNLYRKSNKYAEFSGKVQIEGGLCCPENAAHVYDCLDLIHKQKIPGDIVNLGVFKGNSMKYILDIRDSFGMNDKIVYGFDTFDGFLPSHPKDVYVEMSCHTRKESKQWKGISPAEVRSSLQPHSNFQLIVGDISKTISSAIFEDGLSMVIFDMDDYSPTKIGLESLYGKLNKHGFFIHDHYRGSTICNGGLAYIGQRLATDEFLERNYMFNLAGTNVFQKLA